MLMIARRMPRARRRVWVLAGTALLAIGTGLMDAVEAGGRFGVLTWMALAWGLTVLVSIILNISRHGLPERDPTPPPRTGDVSRDVTDAVDRWQDGWGLPRWQRTLLSVATLAAVFAGSLHLLITGERSFSLPTSWWLIGLGVVVAISLVEIIVVLRSQDDSDDEDEELRKRGDE